MKAKKLGNCFICVYLQGKTRDIMKYTEIPRSLLYRDYTIDELISAHPLNEKLIDNMFKINWMREGDFEANAVKCMNTAYYLYMVMRMTTRPKYQAKWCYRKAITIKNDGGLSQLVTIALLLKVIEHGNEEWAKANEDFRKQIESDCSMLHAVKNVESDFGVIIPQSLDFRTIVQFIDDGVDKDSRLPDTPLFKPLPILDGIKNTYLDFVIIDGLDYVIEQIRALKSHDEQQQCVDAFMLRFKRTVNNMPEIQNTFDGIESLCKEFELTIPERILEEKAKKHSTKKVGMARKSGQDGIDKRMDKLQKENEQLRQKVSALEEALESEMAKKIIEPNEEEEDAEMLAELDSTPILKLLWYLMQLDGANVEGHGKQKAAQSIMATLTKIPFNTTKHFWKHKNDPITKQEELIVKMNLWMKAVGMKFQF